MGALSDRGYFFAEAAPPGPHRLGLAMSFVCASRRGEAAGAAMTVPQPSTSRISAPEAIGSRPWERLSLNTSARRDLWIRGQSRLGPFSRTAADIVVRAAEPADLEAIHALEVAAFATDRLSRRALRRFIGAAHRPLIVAKFGPALAGYALLAIRKDSKTARIYSLAVDPRQGRRGVGRALLQACERYARGHGRCVLRLEVRYDNPAAIALYEKFGYRQFGRYPGYYADGAEALRFEKTLRTAPDDGTD
jgi:[ribosomal protein S18]-alanine N-acetyltransferase